MNSVFSKNKEKRSRSSSSETNNSFVKNVTSRVSGLLPAAVTKWFSSPSSSNANGSAPSADATDSSTEDEGSESPVTTQPPPKRMRYTSPGSYNHYSSTETNCIGSDLTELESCSPFGTVQSPPGRATFRRETNFVSTPLRSGEESVADITVTEKDSFKTQHSVSAVGSSVAMKRKSLFDSPNRAETSIRACVKTSSNTVKDPSQPCFKPSLLGSPFYPGRTMYGGASASYINQPNIKLRRNTVVNESSTSDNTVSQSTRRIMDLLEHYSSPLNEAKRIPHYTRTPRNTSLSSSVNSTSPPSNNTLSYKTQELHVPSVASILRLKQRSRLMDTTNAARQIIASHSSTSDYVPYPSVITHREQTTEKESSNKLTTKVKSRLTRPKRGESIDIETELPTPVNLPTATLEIDQNNLPKFSFGTPNTTASTNPTFTNIIPSKETNKITETPSRKPDIITSSNPYKFSSPVRLSADGSQSETTPPKFTFGSPERSIENAKDKKDDEVSCFVGARKESDKNVTNGKDWQCADCWVNNKPDKEQCVCCGGKKPTKHNKAPAKCSICKLADSQPLKDKCVNCEKVKMNNVVKPITKPDDSSKWKCEDCWVSNDSSAEACVCCGAKNTKKSSVIKQNNTTNVKDSEWKCDDCWIKNKSNIDKCAACGASKPGAKQSSSNPVASAGFFTSPLPKPPDNAFKNIVKSQTDKWECPSCLVRNDGDKNKCVCCETEREGTTKESDKKSFNFGMNTNTTFKFGIDPKAQVATTPTETKITTESKKEESETNNNVLPKTPSFTFGVPAKKPEDQTDSVTVKKVEEKTDSAPKMNFSFGIPKTASTPASTPAAVPVFGAPKQAAKTADDDKEKPQVVPKVDFSMPSTQPTSKPLINIFASSPPASQPSQEKQTPTAIVTEKPVGGLILNSTAPAEKKEPPSNPLLPQAAATSATPAPQVTASATFTFGSGGLKLSSNMFNTPATTTNSSITFGSLQSTTSSAPSMFQPSEPKTTATVPVFGKTEASASLFQKPETPATTAAPASAPAPATAIAPAPAPAAPVSTPAPMFSFGSTLGQPQPTQTEKPKFNFTFGSNKTETPSLFKPPENKLAFGATMENKFTLPTTNPLSGTNSITGNTMGGNGLPVSNSIGVNIASGGNGLPNSNLVQNPLATGNSMPASNALGQSGGIFGSTVPKENNSMWPSNNNTSTNMFTSGNTTIQKPGAFSFGSSTPFNASAPTPAFGASAQSPPNVFGMSQPASSQPSMFSTPSQPATNVFGSPQSNATPSLGMFGTPNVGAAPTFGTPSQSIPTFEAPSLTPAPAPAFNFGGQQQATGIFGFGQQQQQPQQQQAGGVYAFGGAAGAAPQVQFNMGSAPNAPNAAALSQRRMRKAVRRTTPR